MGIISVLIALLLGFFGLLGNATYIDYDHDTDPIDRYDIVRKVEIAVFDRYIGVLLPVDWIATCDQVILFSANRDQFNTRGCMPSPLPANAIDVGSISSIPRTADVLGNFGLSVDVDVMTFGEQYLRMEGIDERGVRAFDAGGRDAVMITTPVDENGEQRIQVYITYDSAFGIILFSVDSTENVLLYEDILRAVATTMVVEVGS